MILVVVNRGIRPGDADAKSTHERKLFFAVMETRDRVCPEGRVREFDIDIRRNMSVAGHKFLVLCR